MVGWGMLLVPIWSASPVRASVFAISSVTPDKCEPAAGGSQVSHLAVELLEHGAREVREHTDVEHHHPGVARIGPWASGR